MDAIGVSSLIFTVNNKKKSLSSEYSLVEHDKNYERATAYKKIDNSDPKVFKMIDVIFVTSVKTGKTTEWEHNFHITNNEGEFLYDEFYPSAKTLMENPQLEGYKMTIFND